MWYLLKLYYIYVVLNQSLEANVFLFVGCRLVKVSQKFFSG